MSADDLPATLRNKDFVPANRGMAKNVILFIGDGMGISTITAARIFDGQSKGKKGEDHSLVVETFPHMALVKTYNTNQQVSDSAGTATAMLTGVKTRAGVIGINSRARRGQCAESLTSTIRTIAEIAEAKGKATGIVTTTRITHATPAAAYAHVPERDWESNRFIPLADWNLGCRDIATQFVDFGFGDGIDIALGGGRREFFGADAGGQRRSPDEDLVTRWLSRVPNRTYVSTLDELRTADEQHQVLGLFNDSHLTYMAERKPHTSEPTLSEMSRLAVDRLQRNKNGFYLLVESGKIDLAHHSGRAGYALLETQEFMRAIEAVLERVNLEETLVLVTADHSHVFTIAGYPTRGNPILGLVTANDGSGEPDTAPALAADGVPYSTLGYTNGPGAVSDRNRATPDVGVDAVQQSAYSIKSQKADGSYTSSETHGGEDVALFAAGPWSHLVTGVLEQDLIFAIMGHALGWDDEVVGQRGGER